VLARLHQLAVGGAISASSGPGAAPRRSTAGSRAAAGECLDVVGIERSEACLDAGGETVPGQEAAVRRGGGRESAGDSDPARSEVADHLAQRRVLATYAGNVGDAKLGQPHHVVARRHVASAPVAVHRGNRYFTALISRRTI
jgi:hypothetical protein